NYQQDPKLVFPGPWGGHNWHPMSFNPNTGLVYLPAHDTSLIYTNDTEFEHRPWAWNLGMDIGAALDQLAELPEFKGYLIAWDPIQRKAVWRKQHKGFWNGGTLATAGGLVFQGTGDGLFAAYDADSGDVMWQTASTTGIMAPPVSYSIAGEQYVAVAAGYGGGVIGGANPDAIINDYHNEGRVLVFKLGGNAAMPMSAPRDKTVPKPPAMDASEEQLAQGKELYGQHCSPCHGGNVVSSWVVPDLRYLSADRHAIFTDIVVNGALQSLGMPEFSDYLEADSTQSIHAFVIAQAKVLYDEEQADTSGD
ncbi:MAG: c-type cytochrome, partial [Pseudomonadales bacterium]